MTSRRSATIALLAAGLLLATGVAMPSAQEGVRLEGRVQWVASTSMQMMTAWGTSVALDLTHADQSSYRTLRTGELIVVDGVVSVDRRRVVAHEIWRVNEGSQAP